MGKGATGKYLFSAANLWWRLCSILLLLLVARCLETIDVCLWRMFVIMSVVVTVWGYICSVAAVVKGSTPFFYITTHSHAFIWCSFETKFTLILKYQTSDIRCHMKCLLRKPKNIYDHN